MCTFGIFVRNHVVVAAWPLIWVFYPTDQCVFCSPHNLESGVMIRQHCSFRSGLLWLTLCDIVHTFVSLQQCWLLSKDFLTSTDMITWFCPWICFCDALYLLIFICQMISEFLEWSHLDHDKWMIFLMCSWVWFASTLLRHFESVFIGEAWSMCVY